MDRDKFELDLETKIEKYGDKDLSPIVITRIIADIMPLINAEVASEKHRADVAEEENAVLREALKYVASEYARDTRKQRYITDGVFIEHTIQTAVLQASDRLKEKQ